MTDRADVAFEVWAELPAEAVRDGCAVLRAFLAGRHGDVLELMRAAAEEGRAGEVTLAALATAAPGINDEVAALLEVVAGETARHFAARVAFGTDPPEPS